MQEKCCKSAQKKLRAIKSFVKQEEKKATAPSETKRSEEINTLYLY